MWLGVVGSLKFHFLSGMSSRDREITEEMRFRWVFLREVRHFSLGRYYGNGGRGDFDFFGKNNDETCVCKTFKQFHTNSF